MTSKTRLTGAELIKSELLIVPSLPGVYQMFDNKQQILYIGKAKDLRKRLTSYTKLDSDKALRIVSATYYLEYTVTTSEVEALLLEAQLIKKLQPKFNVLLKDGKAFPYIKLRIDHPYPQFIKYRGKNIGSGEFFGPYTSSQQVDIALLEIQKIFKLRSCNDNFFATRKRPCLQYQIGRCSAPCTNKISHSNYLDLVSQAKDFFAGKAQKLQQTLSNKMTELSEQLHFEQAAEIRDRIKALSQIQLKAENQRNNIIDADIVAIAEKNSQFCIQVFLCRSGMACGSKSYFFAPENDAGKEELLEAFLLQFYQDKAAPQEIILNHSPSSKNLIEQAIKKLHGNKVKITVKNNNSALIANAYQNASLSLDKHLKHVHHTYEMFLKIKEIFNLDTPPERIEIYDNSHLMGSFATGAMVVATQSGFAKKEYRLFNVKPMDNPHSHAESSPIADNSFGGDDYYMLAQMLRRRLAKLQNNPSKKPSLIIIDGGKGQLSVAKRVMEELKANIPFVCMSKGPDRDAGREQFHLMDGTSFTLDKNEAVMKYLQLLRDEAHNFAIKQHRLKRSKPMRISKLDDIPLIGQKRKKALLNYFGSYKDICDASVTELAKVSGISLTSAKAIYSALHNKPGE